jgi:hypothetical protein
VGDASFKYCATAGRHGRAPARGSARDPVGTGMELTSSVCEAARLLSVVEARRMGCGELIGAEWWRVWPWALKYVTSRGAHAASPTRTIAAPRLDD